MHLPTKVDVAPDLLQSGVHVQYATLGKNIRGWPQLDRLTQQILYQQPQAPPTAGLDVAQVARDKSNILAQRMCSGEIRLELEGIMQGEE